MRNFFKEMLLGEYSDKLEKYGEQRPYKKLSDEIIHALDNSAEEDRVQVKILGIFPQESILFLRSTT
jgi:hypothetical protein